MIPNANVANCQYNLQNYNEAYQITKEIYEKRVNILSESHIQLIQDKILMMKCLVKLNKKEEAKNIYGNLLNVVSTPDISVGKYNQKFVHEVWENLNK